MFNNYNKNFINLVYFNLFYQLQSISQSPKLYNKMSSFQSVFPKLHLEHLFNCEDYPIGTIIRIDDDYCSMSGYFQMHDIPFQLPAITYGNQQMRKNYKITKQLKKYFAKRHFYFSQFDQGIELDNQSWYSVVAEPISRYLCERLKFSGTSTLLEPFCGVGGIAVHAAGNFQHLVVNDIDKNKLRMLKNNLSVYGKSQNLLTIQNKDALKIKPYNVDAVLICPPWGGIDISQYSYRDLDEIMLPKLSDILNHFKKFSKNMILQLPKNTNLRNLLKIINMCCLAPIIKVQKILVDGRISQLFVFIGDQKFTAFNPKIYSMILQDAHKNPNNLKNLKKDLKLKLKQEKFQIFSQIFQNHNLKENTHIFFDDSQSNY